MATETKNLCNGPATLSLSPYVAAGGGGSFADVGHTSGPTLLTMTMTNHKTKSERAYGAVSSRLADYDLTLQIPMLEVTTARWAQAIRQPAGNVSGTLPASVFLVGAPENSHTNGLVLGYLQIKLESEGPLVGTSPAGTRTILAWKCAPASVGSVSFGKEVDQMFDVTFDVLWDDSVSTNDKFLTLTDA